MPERTGLNPLASQKIQAELKEIEKSNNTNIPIVEASEKIYQKLQSSIIDSLTGIYNRRYLDDYIKNFDGSREKNDIAIIFCDINNLKAVNTISDKLGDELIQKTANFLTENTRDSDRVVRKGGDEFVVLCENIDDFSKFRETLSDRFDKNMALSKIQFAYGFVQFDPTQEDKSLRDTIERGNFLMKQKKSEQKSQQNFSSNLSAKE